jgi:hypothetical protein
MQPQCNCQTATSAFNEVTGVINANISALNAYRAELSAKIAQLNAAEQALLGMANSFEIQMVGRCTIGALEAVAVGKAVTSLRAVCATGSFAAQCVAAGFTTKEVVSYVARQEAVRQAVIAVATETAAITAKVSTNETPGWTQYIPIVGSVCSA